MSPSILGTEPLIYGSYLAVSNISRIVVIAFYISGDPYTATPTHVAFCGA